MSLIRPKTLLDIGLLLSIVGIWSRFIEPSLLFTKRLTLSLPLLKEEVTLLHFSDLHIGPHLSDAFLRKLSRKINALPKDLILFTGDFLSFSTLSDKERLIRFLSSLKAPCGFFAVLGNHDYNQYVFINDEGFYDCTNQSQSPLRLLTKLFERTTPIQKKFTPRLNALTPHEELLDCLKKSSVQLLHNQTTQIPLKKGALNLTGLGEYSANQLNASLAFTGYNRELPGIVLIHNGDGFKQLPLDQGNLILSGHTHGGQINLPYFREKLTRLEDPQYLHGLFSLPSGKKAFVSRGVGSAYPCRFLSPPEIVHLTLRPMK